MNEMTVLNQFNKDFSPEEQQELGKPCGVVRDMVRGDCIKIPSDMLDYLQEFQNEVFRGEPIPKVFSKALLEVQDPSSGTIHRIYVTFPENKPNWVYIDIYINWLHVAKTLYYNVKIPEDCKYEDTRRYWQHSPVVARRDLGIPADVLGALVSAARDYFTYAYLYVWANQENHELFKEEDKITDDSVAGKKNRKKQKNRKKTPLATRDTVYVPKRRVYTVKKVQVPENLRRRRNEPEYHLSEWPVKGHVRRYKQKDGSVKLVDVKPHTAKRRKNNAGIIKDPGKDYLLRPHKKDKDTDN